MQAKGKEGSFTLNMISINSQVDQSQLTLFNKADRSSACFFCLRSTLKQLIYLSKHARKISHKRLVSTIAAGSQTISFADCLLWVVRCIVQKGDESDVDFSKEIIK
jgi:hypothetical protein